MFQRLRIYLQAKVQQPGTWIRRASDSVRNPELVGDEMEYQFFLAIEHPIREACEWEGGKDEITHLITAIVNYVSTEELLNVYN